MEYVLTAGWGGQVQNIIQGLVQLFLFNCFCNFIYTQGPPSFKPSSLPTVGRNGTSFSSSSGNSDPGDSKMNTGLDWI